MKFPFEIVSFQGRHSPPVFFPGHVSFTMNKMLSSRLLLFIFAPFSRLRLFFLMVELVSIRLPFVIGGVPFQIFPVFVYRNVNLGAKKVHKKCKRFFHRYMSSRCGKTLKTKSSLTHSSIEVVSRTWDLMKGPRVKDLWGNSVTP